MVEEGYYSGSQILDFKATLDLYVGINLANGESGYSLANSYYVLDKDMKKQLVYEAGDKTYLTNAGMITAEVTSGNTVAIIAKALADKEFEEAEIPEYSDNVVYRNSETIFEASGKKNSSLNVKGTGNNLTIATNVELSHCIATVRCYLHWNQEKMEILLFRLLRVETPFCLHIIRMA